MRTIETRYYTLVVLDGPPIVKMVRNERLFETVPDVEASFLEIDAALEGLDRANAALMIDLRAARGRNDPEFEHAVSRYRTPLLESFPHVAILLRTMVGKLQLDRHMREDRSTTNAHTFVDENECLAYLRSALSGAALRGPA